MGTYPQTVQSCADLRRAHISWLRDVWVSSVLSEERRFWALPTPCISLPTFSCERTAQHPEQYCRFTSSGGFPWLWIKKSVKKLKDVRLGAKLDLARLRLPRSWDEQSFCKEKQTEGENPPYLWAYPGHIMGIYWYIGWDKQSFCKEKQTGGEI